MADLVSCIMPTFNRRHFVPLAIKCYLSQDWPTKELIIVDDGTDCVKDLCDAVPDCRYFRTEKFKTLGEKVNFCCGQTQGEIIVTWDDDDWYAPNRITDQVTRLIESGKSLTGYHSMLFYDGQKASQYRGAPNYAVGNSQVYRKAYWEKHRFDAVDIGYDNGLSRIAAEENQIVCIPGEGMAVARIHRHNVTGNRGTVGHGVWPFVERETLPEAFLGIEA